MFLPGFNPYGFSRMTQRERMVSQLNGHGLGSFGLMQMVTPKLGVLTATNRLDPLEPAVQVQAQMLDPLAVNERTAVMNLAERRGITDTTFAIRPIDSMPVSVAVQQTHEEPSVPDTGLNVYAQGHTPSEVDPTWGQREQTNWEGDAPANNTYPTYDAGGDNEGGVPTVQQQPPSIQTQAAQVLAQPSSGVPWWGWALGAAAVGFGVYKLAGKKR